MKILVHICCSVDSHYFLSRLQAEYPSAQLIGYFYDPNIHPIEEYELRFLDVARSCYALDILLLKAPYDDGFWLAKCSALSCEPERGKRCDVCFDIRLERTFAAAKFLCANAFATTLSCSPKKDLSQLAASAQRIIQKPCRTPKSQDLFDTNDAQTAKYINDFCTAASAESAADSTQPPQNREISFLNPDYRQNGGTQQQMALAKASNLYHQNYCGCAFALAASREFTPELFSSASGEILPNSAAARSLVFGEIFARQKAQKPYNLRKNKILNYRLLHAKVLQNKAPAAAIVLFYSHFTCKRAAINLDSLITQKAQNLGFFGADAAGFLRERAKDFRGALCAHPLLLRAQKDDICIIELSALKEYLPGRIKSAKDWLRRALDINTQLELRALINPTALHDLSPIIVLDSLHGKLEISALSKIWADTSLSVD